MTKTNLIALTTAGSHLFGLNTEKSDKDFKGVFQETLDNIILGKDAKNINTSTNTSNKERNNSEDIDTELKELRTFIRDCLKGQTYAVEMLFCPSDKIITSTPTWEFIQEHRDKLIPKDISPFVGYCRSQAQKYSLRGTRLEQMERVYEWFKSQPKDAKLFEVIDNLDLTEYNPKILFTETFTQPNRHTEERLVVNGIIFQYTKFIKECLPSLEKRLSQYGNRSELSKEMGGVDWKAYSHAFRLLYEWEQMLTERQLTFPVRDRDYILSIKKGELPFEDVQERMFQEFDRINAIPNTLPEPDVKFWEGWLLTVYR